MGADLYVQPEFTANREKLKPLWDRAVAAREERMKECEALGIMMFFDKKHHFLNGTKNVADPKLKAIQEVIFELDDKMHPDHLYFRDSYNSTSVMAQMHLSWWNHVTPMLKEGVLDPDGCIKLAEMIEKATLDPVTKADVHLAKDMTDDEIFEYNAYFTEKKDRLIRFLRNAAQKNGVYCSL